MPHEYGFSSRPARAQLETIGGKHGRGDGSAVQVTLVLR
jgi:hypothetical protein